MDEAILKHEEVKYRSVFRKSMKSHLISLESGFRGSKK